MSHQKNSRRVQQSDPDLKLEPKYRNNVFKLRELFPTWSDQDLQSVLIEVSNDVETAVTRISEGHAEQWGNVSRKKDKRGSTIAPSPSATPPPRTGSARGMARGGRGGFTRGKRGGAPTGRSSTPRSDSKDPAGSTGGWGASTTEGWGDVISAPAQGDWTSAPVVEKPAETETFAETIAPTANGIDHAAPAPKNTPATTGLKLSWAQIARPQEKPKPVVPPSQPTAVEAAHAPELVPPTEAQPEAASHEWEEPTTVQAPTWEEEEAVLVEEQEPQEPPISMDDDQWVATKEDIPLKTEAETEVLEKSVQEPVVSPVVDQPTPSLTTTSELSSVVASPTPPPGIKPVTPRLTNSRAASRFKTDQAVVMPSFGAMSSGIGAVGMQFGSLNIGDDNDQHIEPPAQEPEPSLAPAPIPTTVVASVPQPQPEVPQAPLPSTLAPPVNAPIPTPSPSQPTPQATTIQTLLPQSQPSDAHPPHLPVSTAGSAAALTTSSAPTLASLANSASFFHPQHTQSLHPQNATTQTLGGPFSSSFTPLSQLPQQQAATSGTQPPPPQIGITQQSYAQHGLSTHADSPPIHQIQSHQPSHNQNASSYYRQQDYSGFTPSNQQSLLSQHSSLQQQQSQGQQPSHQDQTGYGGFSGLAQGGMGNFQNPDFGAYDQRGFYDGAYSQQNSFGSRNFFDQNELGKLPGSQPHQPPPPSQQPAGSLPSAVQQSQNLGTGSQSGSTPGPGGQGQNYPPPVPYYYNPYYGQHNPYYAGPNPNYGIGQPFMKYPLYPQGPPAPGPGTPTQSAGGKVGGQNVPPPAPNAYTSHSGLYGPGGHHQGSYDEGGYHPGGADYVKPSLYGGLGHGPNHNLLAQSSRASQQGGAGGQSTPDNSYKPYGASKAGGAGSDTSRGPLYGSSVTASGRFGGVTAANVNLPGSGAGGAGGPPGVGQGQGQGSYGPQGGADSGSYYQQYQRPQFWQ